MIPKFAQILKYFAQSLSRKKKKVINISLLEKRRVDWVGGGVTIKDLTKIADRSARFLE